MQGLKDAAVLAVAILVLLSVRIFPAEDPVVAEPSSSAAGLFGAIQASPPADSLRPALLPEPAPALVRPAPPAEPHPRCEGPVCDVEVQCGARARQALRLHRPSFSATVDRARDDAANERLFFVQVGT